MLVVSYPRSGSTWLCYLLAYCLNTEYDDLDQPGVHPRGAGQRRLVKGGLPHASHHATVGRVLKTHRLDLRDPGPRVYLVRDGRDVLISYYYFLKYVASGGVRALLVRALPHLGPQAQGLRRFVWLHARRWARHVTRGTSEADHTVRYEDLRADTPGTLSRLLRELGVNVAEDVLRQAVELFSFGRLTAGVQRSDPDRAFYRRGEPGGWRTHFPDASDPLVPPRVRALLHDLGYAEE